MLGFLRFFKKCRASPKRIEGPDGRNLQLQFKSMLSLPLFTGGKVEGEQGSEIHVVLLDANTGFVVTSGLESSAKLDVVVLEGDFNNEDDDNWTEEEFESHLVKEREGKRPLLTGDLQVSLKEGVGTLGELTFTDNSSWIRSRKFRLGLRIASGFCEGIRIREAKTEAFIILGGGMSNRMWESLIEHAKTCPLTEDGRYGGNQMTRCSSHPQFVISNAQLHYEDTSLTPQNQFCGYSGLTQVSRNDNLGLALGPSQHSSFGIQLANQPILSSNLNSYYDWSNLRQSHGVDDYLTEEEIRVRSHEILENEEMQQLLRHLSMVGSSSNVPGNGFEFPSFVSPPSPPFNFDVDQNRSSGKAVVGWLKIKAAMRWGIFIRKKVAERRRAQLVELED
ncbi:hypothetical protein GW17_00055022 [Ensete ventricosum]|nr:hypothetical protein GW17_00055022 [Ensete ventricosum]